LQQARSIFVVDDDMSIRTSLKRLLREYGFAVRLFGSVGEIGDISDVREAVCLILDINLNGQSGIDLRRKLAAGGVTAPVIYITGNDSSANRAAAIESGCVAYLTKPFTAQSLIESVARAAAA
jgi:FixJ family two-component response regulator